MPSSLRSSVAIIRFGRRVLPAAVRAHAVTLLVAVVVLATGLSRSGVWQPSELHMADMARDGATDREAMARPPAQLAAIRAGFRWFGASERGGRLPTALLAVIATLALSLAVGSAIDARAGAFAGVAYATMPLVFQNARQMFGGGVAQSMFTLLFAGLLFALWARPPPAGVRRTVFLIGRWSVLVVAYYAAMGSGWMLGVLPVGLGIAGALLLRWRHETNERRIVGLLFAGTSVALTVVCLRAMVTPHPAYSVWLGVGPDAHGPTLFPTFDVVIEQIGLAMFPWTGVVAFGVVRLLQPPPVDGVQLGAVAHPVSEAFAWNESGVRLVAFFTLLASWGLQTLHWQAYGASAFVGAAPLAVAAAVALRDCEREGTQWRLVAAMALFVTAILVRDLVLFPKSSFAALGLPDGGPTFPTAFTGKLVDWFKAHSHRALGATLRDMVSTIATGAAPAEVYFLLEGVAFTVVALCALFLGGGPVARIAWSGPYLWLLEVERRARVQFDTEHGPYARAWREYLTPLVAFMYLRGMLVFVACVAESVLVALVWRSEVHAHQVFTLRDAIVLAIAPVATVVVLIYAVVALWNAFSWLGAPEGPVARVLGSRIAFVPIGGVLVALVSTQVFMPSLSEHLSPRGVWAVVRQFRREGEPVARYGGNLDDRATRYYANFDVHALFNEPAAVEWLHESSPRHFLIVGGELFASLNRAYRAAMPVGARRNVPVLDADNHALLIAASTPGATPSVNPLESVVFATDTLTRANGDHWHAFGHRVAGRFEEQPARFGDAIEYTGFNLDSSGQAFVPIGGSFTITYHFHVLAEVPGNQQLFVHVDGRGACPQFNADHDTGNPDYPMNYPVRLWLPGDVIHDRQRITIPSSCRAGSYAVYIGFFQGSDRMPVTAGDHGADNRVVAASVNVR